MSSFTPAVMDRLANIMSELSAVAPPGSLTSDEALYAAELQAQLLLERAVVLEPPVPSALLENIPSVEILWESEPRLVIGVDPNERLRLIVIGADADTIESEIFALAYGLKRLLDAPAKRKSYSTGVGRVQPEETPAYRFATSLLMPRTWLQEAWKELRGRERDIADRFGVEQIHVHARLVQLGIT